MAPEGGHHGGHGPSNPGDEVSGYRAHHNTWMLRRKTEALERIADALERLTDRLAPKDNAPRHEDEEGRQRQKHQTDEQRGYAARRQEPAEAGGRRSGGRERPGPALEPVPEGPELEPDPDDIAALIASLDDGGALEAELDALEREAYESAHSARRIS